MGRIADIAKSNIPVTWSALLNDSRIGGSTLTLRETYVTNTIFGSVPNDAEQDALAQIVADYAGMKLAVDVIDVAIDFWMDVEEERVTSGPREEVNYAERLKHLQARKTSLMAQIAMIEPTVIPLIPSVFERASAGAPLLSSIDQEMLTPDPFDFGAPYAPKEA